MSLLGNYIHYGWYRYKRLGTYKDNSEGSGNNFHTTVFSLHSSELYKQIRSLKISNLAQLEAEYNNLNDDQILAFKNLLKNNKSRFEIIMTEIIKSLGEKYIPLAATMARDIQINNDSIVYTGGASKKIVNYIGPPPNFSFGAGKEKKGTGIARYKSLPRINFCKEMVKYIEKSTNNPNHPDIKELQKWIVSFTINRNAYLKQRHTLKLVINKKDEKIQTDVFDLPEDIAITFDQYAMSLRTSYISIGEINEKLQAVFDEFIGNILYYDINMVVNNTMLGQLQAISQALTVGKQQTSSGAGKLIVDLDINEAKGWIEQKNKEYKNKIKTKGHQVLKDKYTSLFLDFSHIGDATQQKADVEVALSGQWHGISLKNTNLQARNSDTENLFDIPHVSLQDSSLILYLADIEKNYENLGNHYLNIFAAHKRIDSLYSNMRKQANKALTLHILWSSLTGQGQLRTGGQANIFAIYDKASRTKAGEHRVKFFDMASIILNYFNNPNGFAEPGSIFTQINDIELENDWNSKGEDARITRLLLDARDHVIIARLTTEYLRNIYQGIQ